MMDLESYIAGLLDRSGKEPGGLLQYLVAIQHRENHVPADAVRILDERFYGAGGRHAALQELGENRCRFLVAARHADARVRTLEEIALPPEFANLFRSLPADRFLERISSTELRQRFWRAP